MKVQFLRPNISDRDIKAAASVLKSGWLVLGDEGRKFEKKFAEYLGVREVVLTNSCTTSIHLSLMLAGVKPGDEVITTPLSYVATANPVIWCGATPRFVDVEPETGLIDVKKIERAITKKTKAIIPVHLYGQMADMQKLHKIASKYGLAIIEDAAHAIESKRDGAKPGQLGLAACFSFHVAKNITSGEGGALVTDNRELAERARLLRRDGVRNIGLERKMEVLGYKYLTTDFQAAMLSSQLKRIDENWRRRKKLFERYSEAFEKAGIKFPKTLPGVKHAYHMFIIWINPKKRISTMESLKKAGIQTSIHYNPIPLEPYYRKAFGCKKGDFPVAERLGLATITLPLYPALTEKQQDYVIKTLNSVINRD